MRPELGLARSVKLQTRRHTQQALKQIQREGVKPRALAGKLKLVGGVAQKRVPEEVGGFRVHGRILSGCRAPVDSAGQDSRDGTWARAQTASMAAFTRCTSGGEAWAVNSGTPRRQASLAFSICPWAVRHSA